MAAVRKFLFDTSFDAGSKAGGAFEAARSPAQAEPEPEAPALTEEDLERALAEGHAAGFAEGERTGRAAGFAEGRDAGHAEAQKAGVHLAAEAVGLVEHRLQALLAERETAQAEARDLALRIARTAVAKLFPRLAERHGLEEIEALLGDCLARLGEEPRVVVRVADDLYDALDERLGPLCAKTGFEGKVVLLSEPDLPAGDLRVEWADGGAERTMADVAAEIDAIIARAESQASAPPAPTDDPAPARPAPAETPAPARPAPDDEPADGAAAASEPTGEDEPAAEPLEG
jgi:flagellar assembly protein FliH